MQKKGLVIVISGPSGTGKGTLLERIRNQNVSVRYSISATTRKPRVSEVDGVNYFFSSVEKFEKMIENHEFLEWVKYCDNYYGTPKKNIHDIINQGLDILLEVEVNGAEKVFKEFPDCISIFVAPPSLEELRRRILNRGDEVGNIVDKRIEIAKSEISRADLYDYIVYNYDVEKASKIIQSILISEKHKFKRNTEIIQTILEEEK